MRRSLRRYGSPGAWFLIAVLCLSGCRPGSERAPEGPPLKLSLAVSPVPYSGLIAIADEKGYFREAGLDVSQIPYNSGRDALEAMARGEAQVATVTSMAFAAKVPEDPSIRILASIGTGAGCQIVARRDRNIRNPSDLRGKKIGITPNSVSDYLLYVFLLGEGISMKDVRTVVLPPERQVDAIVNGEVDAVSAFEMFAFEATKRLGDIAVSWDSQNNISFHWLLVANERSLRSPEPMERFLKALVRAEYFSRAQEEEAKRILIRKWGFDPAFLQVALPKTRLNVSFDQSIVTSQVNYADWYMRKAGKSASPPDVMNYMHTGILEKVAPGSVTVFR